ncbi:GNAT family N-acetyltransferase [Confluentibacter lentus]|uniref:GNAT family N-acetyltransferase n=1 Tax=Confluentibacter lentus TaxID=1699412 RepID=UPI000C28BC56|nr:GNAT family N-acetyltransferase [Confluentibacter lentus]
MEVKHLNNGRKGSFYVEIDNNKVAEMTYSHAEPNKIIIDHTEVSDTLKGQGVGYKLIDAAVEYMRANNLKVIPLCPFANAVFKKEITRIFRCSSLN